MAEEELSFDSAAGLFEALDTPDAIARRRILHWVATHPADAIALGIVGGRDVVDVLIGLVPAGLEYRYWEDLAATIGTFDAPRVTEFFVELLARADGAIAAQDAATALARRQYGAHRQRLVEILLSDEAPDRAAAAAGLLVGDKELAAEAAVRVAALESERQPPKLTDPVADSWAKELLGPFGAEARDRLEGQGAKAARALAPRWEALGEEDRAWLLEWATGAAPAVAERLIAAALETGPDSLARVALECAGRLPDGSIDPGLLGPWAQHPDPVLRGAAIGAGAAADPAFLLAEGGADPEIVIAAILRLAELEGANAVPEIGGMLSSGSVEVRAAAREALVALGPDAVEPLRPLVHSSDPETRAGAVRALLDLGDDDWLARGLLD